jgi:hypothetical protein
MNINEALERASRILEEEQVAPTLGYRYVSETWPSNQLYDRHNLQQQGYTPAIAAQIGLIAERKVRPRQVYEDPKKVCIRKHQFQSSRKDL